MASFKLNFMLASTIVLWSSAFVGIRFGLMGFSPGPLALFRFLVASACMWIIHRYLPSESKMPWSDRVQLLLLGIVGIGFYNICLNYGELSVSAGVASFIMGLMPVMTLLLSVIFLHERPALTIYFGISLSCAGLFCMGLVENSHAHITQGMFIILLSALSGAVYSLLLRPFLRAYHPVTVSAWSIWGGALSLMYFAPALGREIGFASAQAIIAAVYMGVFPAAFGYISWSYVLNYMPASKATLYLYALPIASTLLGFMLLHEQPYFVSLLGGVIALLGALFASWYQSQPLKKVDKERATG